MELTEPSLCPAIYRSFAILGFVGAIVLAGSEAKATLPCPPPEVRVLPDRSSLNVPTNTRIWYVTDDPSLTLSSPCDQTPRLLDADGTEIPTTFSQMDHLAVLTPTVLLEPMEYTVDHGCIAQLASVGNVASFTVPLGATEDHQPPQLPIMTFEEPEVTRTGAGSHSVVLRVQGEYEDVLLMDIDENSTLDPDALTGSISATYSEDGNAGYRTLSLSRTGCTERTELEEGTTVTFTFASFDLAGNFSGWTGPEPVVLDNIVCQCRASNERPPAMFTVLIMLGLFARRRRPI